jgi:hypothetical protein
MRKTNAATAFPSSSAEDEDNLRVYNLAFKGTENSAVGNETILYKSSNMLLKKSIHFSLPSVLQQFLSEST